MINGSVVDACEGGCKERENNDRKISSYGNGWNAHASHINDIGVWSMNELITKEMIEGGYVPEVIFDKLEEYKSAMEWFDTFKFQVRKAMEQNGIKKWSTDYFDMDFIEEHNSPRVDTKRMKETWFDIVDSNGEVTKVNAYEYFVKNAKVKAHVSYKEKK